MNLPKSFWFDALVFAAMFFLLGLGLDWLRGRELDLAARGIATAIAMPIYLIVKMWLFNRRKNATDA